MSVEPKIIEMVRYARRVGSIVCGHNTLDIFMVIQTDEVPRDEVLAAGFEPVPAEMSDDEVRERAGGQRDLSSDRRREEAVMNSLFFES